MIVVITTESLAVEEKQTTVYMNAHGTDTLFIMQGFSSLPELFQIKNLISNECEFSYQIHASLETKIIWKNHMHLCL